LFPSSKKSVNTCTLANLLEAFLLAWQTERQTERQTDGQTDCFYLALHMCLQGKVTVRS